MTITSVFFESRTSGWSARGNNFRERYGVNYTGTFDESELLNSDHDDLPQRRASPAFDTSVYVAGLGATAAANTRQDGGGDGGLAYYDATYEPITYEVTKLLVHPLERPPEIGWQDLDITEVPLVSRDGYALVNSAEDLFLDLPEQFVDAMKWVCTINLEDNPAAIIKALTKSTNSEEIWGVAAENGWINSMPATKTGEYFNGAWVDFWRLTVSICFKEGSWRWQPLDRGARDYDYNPAPMKRGIIPDSAFLDGTGYFMASGGEPGVFPQAAGGNPAGYLVKKKAAWSTLTTLGFPDPFE